MNEASSQSKSRNPNLDKQVAKFIRKSRGEKTYQAFGAKVGVTPSTVYRLENCQQSATLRSLGRILGRLGCSIWDVLEA